LPTAAFVTLGCRVNQYESQALKERAEEAGFRVVSFGEGADLVVVNSCTVTAAADSETAAMVRRAKRTNATSFVVVTGCRATEASSSWEGVDLRVPPGDKSLLFALVRKHFQIRPEDAAAREPLPDPWCGGISRFDGHRRAILKVQDGCPFACAYCAVPGARGKSVSRPPDEITAEGRRLAEGGAKELVLAGVQLASYRREEGIPADEPRLAPVVEGLLSLPGIRRVRLSSYGVADFEEALLPYYSKGLCPHLHLPLQSGDPKVLQAMRRPYRLERYREVAASVRQRVPDAGFTTDLIAGFPGEDDAAFQRTLEAVEDLDFLDFHPFPYSERPRTAAIGMGPVVPPHIIRNRMDLLTALKKKRLQENARRVSGGVVEVVAERHRRGFLGGTTDRGLKLAFPQGVWGPGDEVRVRLTGFREDRCFGEVL